MRLLMYTIYNKPEDYPDNFVVRRFEIHKGMEIPDPVPLAVTNTLDEARSAIPKGLFPIQRDPADLKSIVETWL